MTISWSGVRGGPGQGSAEMVARVESSSRAGKGIREEGYCWRVCVCVCVFIGQGMKEKEGRGELWMFSRACYGGVWGCRPEEEGVVNGSSTHRKP